MHMQRMHIGIIMVFTVRSITKRLLSCFLGHIIYALRRNVNGRSGEKRKGFALFFVHRSNNSPLNGHNLP